HAHLSTFNSTTCPDAWAFLYRICNAGASKTDPEVVKRWKEGGLPRQKLIKEFVEKCYVKGESQASNKGRLEALYKLRQTTREWKKGVSGFEWLTEREMRDEKKWPESKVAGAIAFTEKKRLYKRCLYENVRKQGYEKLRELEELLESSGYLREGFDINEGVGDALELSDFEDNSEKKPKPAGRGSGLPELEGPETPDQFVQKYKKYLLNRRAAFKEANDRIKADGCRGHETLGSSYREDQQSLSATMGSVVAHKDRMDMMFFCTVGTLNEMYKNLCSLEIEKKGS
ncbi:unnamed protein product, partial [Symbiodinium sp. CCMP2456]